MSWLLQNVLFVYNVEYCGVYFLCTMCSTVVCNTVIHIVYNAERMM